MSNDRFFPAYGLLNPVDEPRTGRYLDTKNTLATDIIKESALAIFKKDSFENTGPLKGIVLRVDTNPNTSEPTSWISSILGKNYSLKTLKVRIPEIHAVLPEPSSYGYNAGESNKVIDLYPSFVAINEEISNKPVAPGDIVLVDFVNRVNLTQPIYLGPVVAGPTPGAVGQKSIKKAFDKTPTLEVLAPPGDNILGIKDETNYLPQVVIDNKETKNEDNRKVENRHVQDNGGLPDMQSPEIAYKRGVSLGSIELIEIKSPLAAKGGIFIAKTQFDVYMEMVNAAKKQGVNIVLNSGFRSNDQQIYLYNGFINGTPGFNTAAKPKFSNHQTGIAFDIANTQGGRSSTYRWLADNAHKFGFINNGRNFRPQKESWHFEYYGKDSSLVLAEANISSEDRINTLIG